MLNKNKELNNMTNEMIKLKANIDAMKKKLHSPSWDSADSSLYTASWIANINRKQDRLVKLMGGVK